MPLDFGANVGDMSGWLGGQSQAVTPKTDLSPHVDGGQGSNAHTNMNASADSTRVLHIAVGYVLVCVLLLWFTGALVLRGAKL